jgi:uncharacterized protein
MPEALTLNSDDSTTLEAEIARPAAAPRVGVVLCHPHPQYGGSMRSIVISALFEALPHAGMSTLRFNFRGVERSTGSFDQGVGEQRDALAGLDALSAELEPSTPLVLVGWSFGADIAISVRDPRVAAWVAIAPPLHFTTDLDGFAGDPRPKLLLLAEHDEYRPADEVAGIAAGWASTTVEIVGGASHFFVGRTDRVTERTIAFVDDLLPRPT